MSGVLLAAALLVADAVDPDPAHSYPLGDGYWLVAADGGIFAFGDAQFQGSTGSIALNEPIVGMASMPFLEGYWFVAEDGGIFAFGSAGFHGSTGAITLNQPIVGMAAHPSGQGYWFVAADGGIFSFGAARFHGSPPSQALTLNSPIVGMAATRSGDGYWLVAADGGIFSYGDAAFHGSTGAIALNQPIVGMTPTQSGNGYWFVASDGGIFSFGDADFHGSMGAIPLNQPVVGMDGTRTGGGYYMVAADGGIFSFGDAAFHGSTGAITLNQPVVGMAVRPPLAIKVDAYCDTGDQAACASPDGEREEARGVPVSRWENIGGDWRLRLTDNNAGDGQPAGAIIYGVEGLDADQLGTISFRVDLGPCDSNPRFVLSLDINGDGTADSHRSYPCSAGGGGATKSFNVLTGTGPAEPVPAGAKVTALDLISSSTTTRHVDNITAAGLVATDFNTVRAG